MAHQNNYELVPQYVSKFMSLWSVKVISKFLNRNDVQFGLDLAHVFHC